ncbi:MAG: metallophosphoesterase [Candidatus Aenigmarchaeota archaeon ex4484_56]|nr:MAG: metallophosphoesterase [Candidatus Aenigmarchaeota archaeon ex4484_56]
MNIIVISDIHNDVENLLTYIDKINNFDFDVIVCPGDFTDINTPKGFTQEDIAKIIIEELKTLKKPILCVPGNMDTKEIVDYFEKENISIHGKGKIIKNIGFYGYGGAKTPFNTNIEPTEEELEKKLKNAFEYVKNTKIKIQVTHNPPYGTRVDMLQNGMHVGSKIIRNMIEKENPLVAISAHIHEAKGTDNINNTFLINSGKFSEGHFGLIEINENNNKVNGKVLNLNE